MRWCLSVAGCWTLSAAAGSCLLSLLGEFLACKTLEGENLANKLELVLSAKDSVMSAEEIRFSDELFGEMNNGAS